MEKQKSPCLNCQRRAATCHVDCEAYASWRQELDKRKEELQRVMDPEIKRYIRERMHR